MKRALRVKSVGTKVSAAELRVLESRAERAGLTLSEWVRDVLLGSSVDAGTMAAERAILAEVLAMRTILLDTLGINWDIPGVHAPSAALISMSGHPGPMNSPNPVQVAPGSALANRRVPSPFGDRGNEDAQAGV